MFSKFGRFRSSSGTPVIFPAFPIPAGPVARYDGYTVKVSQAGVVQVDERSKGVILDSCEKLGIDKMPTLKIGQIVPVIEVYSNLWAPIEGFKNFKFKNTQSREAELKLKALIFASEGNSTPSGNLIPFTLAKRGTISPRNENDTSKSTSSRS